MQEMVNWPVPGDRYSDSGEGGLFAWMVVPEAVSSGEGMGPNVFATNCHVDVSAYLSRPRVLLNRPDVCVSAAGQKLYEPYDYRDAWVHQSISIGAMLNHQHNPEHRTLHNALHRTLGRDDVSVPLLAAVFLGSTCHSLWHEAEGRYFEVTRDHLTSRGLTQYALWQGVYGVEPVLLTFLDT